MASTVSNGNDRLRKGNLPRRRGTSTLFPDSIEGRFEKSCDKIAQPDVLTLLAICSDERRKSRERAHVSPSHRRRRRKFPFRKRSLPFETVDAISHNGRCHLKRSMPFLMTVDAIVKVDAKKEPIFPTLSDDMRDNQSNA